MALQMEGFSATMTTCTMAPTRARETAQRRQRDAAGPASGQFCSRTLKHFELLGVTTVSEPPGPERVSLQPDVPSIARTAHSTDC